jgi:Ser/Thr protein kinase RdoA (MazF antagonist)
MSIALVDNPNHIRHLCDRLSIGLPDLSPSPVQGGFHHRMWRLQTDEGIYAVKQLSDDTDLANPLVIKHFNLTEKVAETFGACGIDSISALPWQGEYLQIIENSAYLVYPWSEARGLAISQLSKKHALGVARILATMHRADIKVSGLDPQDKYKHPEDQITAVVRRACAIHVRYAQDLEQALPVFLQIAQRYTKAALVLDQHCVMSHGDLDQKNVLWDAAGKPLVIDWESARPLNPTSELLQTGLEWSGITGQFDSNMFEAFLGEYQQAGGVIEFRFVEPALHALLGDWLIWLMYVVDRSASASNPVKRKRGADQFDLVFQTLLRLQQQLPALLAMAVLKPAESKA